jgi:hypothetical protein
MVLPKHQLSQFRGVESINPVTATAVASLMADILPACCEGLTELDGLCRISSPDLAPAPGLSLRVAIE